ncbi:hypothetical protein QBC34DRAFT_401768 [Podospora aff. communis PSN243]|uniref:Uncharacterized protein n=1 Tax=Podospora aff. communis PSN243 TaxID=3040156 RepID=A0AAV9GSC7_9PEZI|nr:hypothetical protein QBC34DRAFT_401768 [Podospora aff. communis PSN243]
MVMFRSLWYSMASTFLLVDFWLGFSDGLFIPYFVTSFLAILGIVPADVIFLVGMALIFAMCFSKVVAVRTRRTWTRRGDLAADRARLMRPESQDDIGVAVPPNKEPPPYRPLNVGAWADGVMVGGFLPLLVLSYGFGFVRRYELIGPATPEDVDYHWLWRLIRSVREGFFEVAVRTKSERFPPRFMISQKGGNELTFATGFNLGPLLGLRLRRRGQVGI